MQNSKKILALILALVMVVSLFAGCAPADDPTTTGGSMENSSKPSDRPSNGNKPTDSTAKPQPTESSTAATEPTKPAVIEVDPFENFELPLDGPSFFAKVDGNESIVVRDKYDVNQRFSINVDDSVDELRNGEKVHVELDLSEEDLEYVFQKCGIRFTRTEADIEIKYLPEFVTENQERIFEHAQHESFLEICDKTVDIRFRQDRVPYTSMERVGMVYLNEPFEEFSYWNNEGVADLYVIYRVITPDYPEGIYAYVRAAEALAGYEVLEDGTVAKTIVTIGRRKQGINVYYPVIVPYDNDDDNADMDNSPWAYYKKDGVYYTSIEAVLAYIMRQEDVTYTFSEELKAYAK